MTSGLEDKGTDPTLRWDDKTMGLGGVGAEAPETMDYSAIGELLNDKTPLSFDAARIFGEVFNTSAAYWLNLDHSYRLWLQR